MAAALWDTLKTLPGFVALLGTEKTYAHAWVKGGILREFYAAHNTKIDSDIDSWRAYWADGPGDVDLVVCDKYCTFLPHLRTLVGWQCQFHGDSYDSVLDYHGDGWGWYRLVEPTHGLAYDVYVHQATTAVRNVLEQADYTCNALCLGFSPWRHFHGGLVPSLDAYSATVDLCRQHAAERLLVPVDAEVDAKRLFRGAHLVRRGYRADDPDELNRRVRECHTPIRFNFRGRRYRFPHAQAWLKHVQF